MKRPGHNIAPAVRFLAVGSGRRDERAASAPPLPPRTPANRGAGWHTPDWCGWDASENPRGKPADFAGKPPGPADFRDGSVGQIAVPENGPTRKARGVADPSQSVPHNA